jgi:hypothetical protein
MALCTPESLKLCKTGMAPKASCSYLFCPSVYLPIFPYAGPSAIFLPVSSSSPVKQLNLHKRLLSAESSGFPCQWPCMLENMIYHAMCGGTRGRYCTYLRCSRYLGIRRNLVGKHVHPCTNTE